MKRSVPLRSTAFHRKESISRSEHPRAKDKECAHCHKPFTPFQTFQKVCNKLRCARGFAKAKREAEKKAEKAKLKAREEAIKTPTELLAKCRKIVQEIARIRDRKDGCISCHMGANYGGRWHGSHFRPAGNHSAVELHLWNIHKSCAQCNLHKGGNIAGYRPRLIAKIGLARVEWLESQNQVTRRTEEYLRRFIDVMGKRLRRMKPSRARILGTEP